MKTLCVFKDSEEIFRLDQKNRKIRKLQNMEKRGTDNEKNNARKLINKITAELGVINNKKK